MPIHAFIDNLIYHHFIVLDAGGRCRCNTIICGPATVTRLRYVNSHVVTFAGWSTGGRRISLIMASLQQHRPPAPSTIKLSMIDSNEQGGQMVLMSILVELVRCFFWTRPLAFRTPRTSPSLVAASSSYPNPRLRPSFKKIVTLLTVE